MSVRIARGTISRIREHPGGIHLQVLKTSDIEASAADLWALDPNFVSDVIRVPDGPSVFIDAPTSTRPISAPSPPHSGAPPEAAGVAEAVVASPNRSNDVSILDKLPLAVVMRLHVTTPQPVRLPGEWSYTEVPDAWVEEAADWVTESRVADDVLWAEMPFVEFGLPVSEARNFLRTFSVPLGPLLHCRRHGEGVRGRLLGELGVAVVDGLLSAVGGL